MKSDDLAFVSMEPDGGAFIACLAMESALSAKAHLEKLLQKAAEVYHEAVSAMRTLVGKMRERRLHRKPVPARMVWELGHRIFRLKSALAKLSLQLDDLYSHLTRDLRVKRMWLEKVIIFRRYLPKKGLIPRNLGWGRCSRTPRRAAQLLRESVLPD